MADGRTKIGQKDRPRNHETKIVERDQLAIVASTHGKYSLRLARLFNQRAICKERNFWN